MTRRDEQVDVRTLLRGSPGYANGTDPGRRLEERARVLAYWPTDLLARIEAGELEPPPWRLLLDPTAWKDVDPAEVIAWVDDHLERGAWPSLDGTRKRFGRVSNHRDATENPLQPSLL